MRTTSRARCGTRATTACRWRQRVVPRDAGHRGQRVLSRLSGRERGTFASRLVQFAITRVAVPRRANGPDPESPLGVHEHESSGDRREHPIMPHGANLSNSSASLPAGWQSDGSGRAWFAGPGPGTAPSVSGLTVGNTPVAGCPATVSAAGGHGMILIERRVDLEDATYRVV